MATTLNGWAGIKLRIDPRLRTITVPGTKGTKVTVRREAAPLFAAFLADWHRLMPPRLNLNDGTKAYGWIYREARSGAGLSNHSGGVATDCRWDILKADNRRHMTPAELKTLQTILNTYTTTDGHHVLCSGAFWKPGSIDEMHTELSASWAPGAKRNTTLADVQNVIKRLKIDNNGKRPLA